MKNTNNITDYLRAGFSGFWIVTSEINRAREDIGLLIQKYKKTDGTAWKVVSWNCVNEPNPQKTLMSLGQSTDTVLIMDNAHWVFDKPQLIQTYMNLSDSYKSTGCAVICLSHKNAIPAELTKDFIMLDFDLPDEDSIKQSISYIAKSAKIELDSKELPSLITAGKGLTKQELENSLALSTIEANGLSPSVLNDQKQQIIEKTGMLEIIKPTVTFNNVLGYDNIKKFVLSTIEKPEAKGILILGAPGCGKTLFMNALVGTTKKIGINLNFGKMFSKYQGDTDQNIESAIKTITAVGECIVLVDEFEKQFAGAGGSGDLDSGVTRRATGRWLRFMQERPKGVYIMGTCNSFKGIPPEYLRAGRWDTAPFFIDLPNSEEKAAILDYYATKFGLKRAAGDTSSMDMWTGAEIEACCSIANMMSISIIEASKFVIAQAKTMGGEISELREWAEGRTIPATTKLIQNGSKARLRKVERK